jgi:hypothetical protein
VPKLPPAPVGQQGPPARAAALAVWALRVARGSLLLTTGTGLGRAPPCLTPGPNTEIRNASNGALTHATLIGINRND